MKAPRFKELFAQLPSLNQPQRLQLLAALHPAAGLDRVVVLMAEIRPPLRRRPDHAIAATATARPTTCNGSAAASVDAPSTT